MRSGRYTFIMIINCCTDQGEESKHWNNLESKNGQHWRLLGRANSGQDNRITM
jgi:hypothetical protein